SRQAANQAVRVRSQLLDRLVNQAGEVMITRSRLEAELRQLRGSLGDLTGNLDRLRTQLREIEVQAESQMQSRMAQAKDTAAGFDPLEFDRFTRVQELTRLMAESVNDVATVQRNIHRVVESTEDDLIAQARQTRELQRDLLRTRMVEFDGISDRMYRVVRLAAKETGKQVKLDILGGTIEMDRGVLDRMTPAFEHLLRNCVAHGIEMPERRAGAGKDAAGQIRIVVKQEGNDVSVEFQDDGAGLDILRIREKALQQGLITPQQQLTDADAANLIFMPGFSTAQQVTELSGRGIGMDVVRAEVNALGGRIETTTQAGHGSAFKLVLPLTTAVTQVVMIRSGKFAIGVPANLVELVRRASQKEVQQAYNTGTFEFAGEQLPFFWSGALLQSSARSLEPQGKTVPVVVFRSAAQRVALHVDEVLGNQEVVVKNLGPQLARLPGLAGMTVLASGAVVLIYNPVALTQVYGELARQLSADHAQPEMLEQAGSPARPQVMSTVPAVPLVLVVDDSITVRRVTQRLLAREGYRVALAADGLQALERLAEELPSNHYLGKPYSEEELLSLVKHYCVSAVTA
ncbi:MAG: putative histidine kinase, CheA, partial [Ramlibacter sp.]|nr:putative histidine kinase, CheA [Ramlibacter sp.]